MVMEKIASKHVTELHSCALDCTELCNFPSTLFPSQTKVPESIAKFKTESWEKGLR